VSWVATLCLLAQAVLNLGRRRVIGCGLGRPRGGGPVNSLRSLTAVLLLFAAACSASSETPSSAESGLPSPVPATGAGSQAPPVATPSAAPAGAMLPSGYRPLWPFASLREAERWQRSYREGGHSPWHLDAAETALQFTTGYLGLPGIDRTTNRRIAPTEAHIGVGFKADAHPSTAAIIHLFRVGSGPDAPWEVVGTDDTTFTLTTPAYGAAVNSPLRAAGRISGVDESIQLRLRSLTRPTPLGTSCCLPAGGQNTPWSYRLTFTKSPGTHTLVAWTGGHLTEVERFTITALHTP
ncbi:hypothetical protein, partial [Actinocorallia lasiicapitis]